MYKKIAATSLLIILALINWAIIGKEKHLTEGRAIYLELAPIDPRSLMQGDYMALRFRIADEIYENLPKTEPPQRWGHAVAASDGFVVVSLDERNIATFKSLFKDQALSNNEAVLRYRVRDGVVKLATNAYFFQEGQAQYYQSATYGQFRVDRKGELLLAEMYDKNLNKLGSKK